MIRVCYIIGQLTKAGAEKQLYELVKGIDKNMFCPIVISLSEGGYWAEEIEKLNIRVFEIPRKKSKELGRLLKLAKLLNIIKPDIVHTYLFSANSYGRIAAILSRVRVIVASERSIPDIGKDKNMFQIYIDKLLGQFSHGIICNSRIASDILVNKYSFNLSKVSTIYNGIDVTTYTKLSNPMKPKKIAKKVIGTVGRLEAAKNHKLFFDMAKVVINKFEREDIKFVIVGLGSFRRELEKYAKDLMIENNVVFAGERTDIPELLNTIDIFVMTSLYEGLSNSIMEAMSAGLPVVASDVGGNRELVVDRETGYLYQSNDVMSLTEKVIFLLENEHEANRLGSNGQMRIASEFSVNRMVKATETRYLELLENK